MPGLCSVSRHLPSAMELRDYQRGNRHVSLELFGDFPRNESNERGRTALLRSEYMLLKSLRFVSLLCAALALGLTLTHDLEIPGKQMLSGASWLVVQHTFYGGFAIVGGLAEVIGLL